MHLPSSYHPATSDQFIGPAQACAEYLTKLAAVVTASGDPFRLIISGPPGVGKSKLAAFLLEILKAGKWNTTKLNGTQLKIEEVEAVAEQFRYTDLFGTYRFLWVEEIDKMPPVARSRLLTFCDDMPRQWALVGTTNCTPTQLKEIHPPTKRRYTFLEVAAPTADDIFALLMRHWPELGEANARRIALFSCGCVGDALQEADAYFINNLQLPKAA